MLSGIFLDGASQIRIKYFSYLSDNLDSNAFVFMLGVVFFVWVLCIIYGTHKYRF